MLPLATPCPTRVPSSAARRRLTRWLVTVVAVVLVMLLDGLLPGSRILPDQGIASFGPLGGLLIFLAALASEYVDSSLGMGYGTTLTPLLLVAGLPPLQIVPCVLLSELITGLTAAAMHQRDGNVDFLRDTKARKTVILLSALSVCGAVSAVALAVKIPGPWLGTAIAIMILAIGVIILATRGRTLRYRAGHIVALGTVAAFNKGLSGGGYGPLVTSGQVVAGVSARQAVAITSLAESLTCAVGLGAYLLFGGKLDWSLALPLIAGATLSVPVATLTVRRLSEPMLRSVVGTATCGLALLALVKLLG